VNIVFYCQGDDGSLLSALRQRLDAHVIHDWSDDKPIPFDRITAAIAWMPPVGFFDHLANLTHIYAVAAGVDHFLKTPGLPDNVDVIRLTDAGMGRQMGEYVLYGALHAQRRMHELRLAQLVARWDHPMKVKSAQDTRVGILGAGQLGSSVAKRLADNHFTVSCWSRSPKTLPEGITSISGSAELQRFVSASDVLVCLLPLTEATTGILNADLFSYLPTGSFLINPGRGAHLVEPDLLDALKSGQLSGAMLDVFSEEPLPSTHPFWLHPRVVVTPHVAAKSLIDESATQIAESIACVEQGGTPAGLVERHRGY